MRLWLDDIRPAPEGWTWVKTDAEARLYLALGCVEIASLDHDLGACKACLGDRCPEQWLIDSNYESMPHCEHVGTGATLVNWMEETGHWPKDKPHVHSANPAGRAKMQAAIDKRYGR